MYSIWSLVVMTAAVILWLSALFVHRKIRNNIINLRSSSSSSSSKVPLGSLGIWPFIGETIHFISCAYSDRPETFTDKRRHMYGKVFKSHLFGSPTIVSTDEEVSKIILQSDAKTFVPSYPKSLMELMGKSSILVINGGLQRRIHGLIGGFFKSPYLKAQITSDMQKYVTQSMGKWTEDCPVYIQDEAKNVTFRVLVKALISLDCGDQMELLKKHFQEFIAGLMSLPLNLPGTQLYRSLQAKKKMVKLIDEIIQGKRGCNKYPGIMAKDVIDALMNDTSEELTDELIAENMIDLMIPGEDSVPVLVTLAIKYLSDCPAALKQFTEKEISNCNFTPFGGGQRLCPGLDLARLEASIFLHHFVTQFRWEAEDDTIINFPTVRMKKRMPIWVKSRKYL
ncbi:3-epi-6-deoxocathasterone 23-monooxygenase [Phtheirospermum japonicum]|uniref:3-epi-6-deoxocathasterone 23-monooxygenase n=1 Tax=Phtheirospermum japonicum TaxID=374723 RepID=A0A830BP79_9LAMI|nr:3-epi-6-deoxocathasterone 23-monooxygenase [Phtheirospermum japonicum]